MKRFFKSLLGLLYMYKNVLKFLKHSYSKTRLRNFDGSLKTFSPLQVPWRFLKRLLQQCRRTLVYYILYLPNFMSSRIEVYKTWLISLHFHVLNFFSSLDLLLQKTRPPVRHEGRPPTLSHLPKIQARKNHPQRLARRPCRTPARHSNTRSSNTSTTRTSSPSFWRSDSRSGASSSEWSSFSSASATDDKIMADRRGE